MAESDVPTKVGAIRSAFALRLPSGPQDAPAILDTLTTDAPDELGRLILQADAIRSHTFDLLGSGPVSLGARIDWHCDFKSGYRWNPSTHYTGIRFGQKAGVDVKVPWELSRGHHLPLLAQAYLLTGTSEYAQEAVDQILHWIATNPPEFGVNWTCPMDAAIRAVNWLWAAALLSKAPEAHDAFFEELLASLLAHGNYLRGNLEVMPDGIRTNHYIADLVGLFYLGVCVPEFHQAGDWAAFAHAGLASEMERQVLSDGVSYESSIPYHRLVAEMFVSAALLARHHRSEFEKPFTERLERMIDVTATYTKPNGLAPQIGDADDGRLHVLSGYGFVDPRDHRHLLAAGAVLFVRADWYGLSGDRWTEALWFGGAHTHRRPASCVAEPTSAAFKDAGIYILRAPNDVVVFTAGRVGSDGLGNHKHNDLLAIEATLAGEDVLVDPGSYVYTPDPAARDAFRSTRAHNTVMVDGVEQNRVPVDSLFRLHADAIPRLVSWEPAPDGGTVTAEHDGYSRLPAPLVHRRTVSLIGGYGVTVEDTFVHTRATGTSHQLCWTFAFAPGTRIGTEGGGWQVATRAGRCLRLSPPWDAGGALVDIRSSIDMGTVSPRYGTLEPAPRLCWMWAGRLPVTLRFELCRLRQE